MNALVLDIETVPLESALAEPWDGTEWTPPSNIKDPVKIEERRAKAEKEWGEKRAKEYSLNPRLGRIVCAGWEYATGEAALEHTVFALKAETESDEERVLVALWNSINAVGGNIVTFNGLTFDVPFFLCRSLIHGITPTVPIKTVRDWLRRYNYSPHFDCRAVLTQWDQRTAGTLTDWAQAFGIPCDDTTKGSDIFELYKAGDFDAIAEHCRSDVQATAKLYEKVSTLYGGIETARWAA